MGAAASSEARKTARDERNLARVAQRASHAAAAAQQLAQSAQQQQALKQPAGRRGRPPAAAAASSDDEFDEPVRTRYCFVYFTSSTLYISHSQSKLTFTTFWRVSSSRDTGLRWHHLAVGGWWCLCGH